MTTTMIPTCNDNDNNTKNHNTTAIIITTTNNSNQHNTNNMIIRTARLITAAPRSARPGAAWGRPAAPSVAPGGSTVAQHLGAPSFRCNYFFSTQEAWGNS